MSVTVYVQNEEHLKLSSNIAYRWELMYSKNFRSGYDGVFDVLGTVEDLLNNVTTFIALHLRDETALVTVQTDEGREVEAIISAGIITYINGLAKFVNEHKKNEDNRY